MAPTDSQYGSLDEKKTPNVTITRSRDPPVIGPKVPVSNLISHWWQEFVVCIVAVLTLLGLFGLLFYFELVWPTPELPSWLSLNAIVSIFTTTIKAAVVVVIASGIGQLKWVWFSKDGSKPLEYISDYDSATRGSWGAAWLLWRLKKSDLLASFGALIIICALGLEPFAQQIINHVDCDIPEYYEPALVNRTSRFQLQDTGANGDNTSVPLPQELQDNLRAAVLESILFSGYECSSGNCTWDRSYTTLGWCSACEDMSAKLQVTNSSYTIGGTTFPNLTSTLPDSMLSVNWTAYTQQLAAISPTYLWETSPNATYADPTSIYIDFIVPHRPEGAVDPSTGKAWPECEDETALGSTSWQCQGYGASRCSLTPCVKAYNATEDKLEFHERLLSSSSNWLVNPTSRNLTLLDASCIGEEERAKLIARNLLNSTSSSDNSFQWLPMDYTLLPTASSPNLTLNATRFEECTFTLDHAFLNSINRFFSTLLNGGMWTPGDTRQILGQDTVKGLYNSGRVNMSDVEFFFSNVSMKLEEYIRTNGLTPYDSSEVGYNRESQVCIAIRWPWFAFPSGLVLGTLVFFFAMVVKTWPRVGGPEIWKCSPLAYMFNALTEEDDDGEESEEERNERRQGRRGGRGTAAAAPAGRKGSLVEQVQGKRDLRNMRRVARRTKVRLGGARVKGVVESGLEYLTSG